MDRTYNEGHQKMTGDDDLQWLRNALSSLDGSIVWTFPEAERKRLGNPFISGSGLFYELMEYDLDEKLMQFKASHPEIQDTAFMWDSFLEALDGQELGEQAKETLSRMIRESSPSAVIYLATYCVYMAVARVEIIDPSALPIRVVWRTRSVESSG